MTLYAFEQFLAVDRDGTEASLAQFDAFAPADTTYSTPLPIFDMGGVPMSAVEANTVGVVQPYQVEDYLYVHLKSGDFIFPRVSAQGLVDEITTSSAASTQALADLQAYVTANPGELPTAGRAPGYLLGLASDGSTEVWLAPTASSGTVDWNTQITNLPTSFTPASHNHAIDALRKTVGGAVLSPTVLALLATADQATARTAIAAAPDTTVSFPGFGSTSAKAMPGNRAFLANEITLSTAISGLTAGTTQAALAELAARPTSTGGSAVPGTWVEIAYTGSAWPTRASASLPTGARGVWTGPISVGQPPIGGLYVDVSLDRYIGFAG